MNKKKFEIKKIIFLGAIFLGASFLLAALIFIYPKFFINQLSEKKPDELIFLKQPEIKVRLEIAGIPYEWSKGLMFRESLKEETGMLFIFPNEEKRSFWMKNTLIPLDIIFISKEKKIVDIKENFEPCPSAQIICQSYSSNAFSMYVLEVNAGFVESNGIEIGDMVKF